MEQNGNQRRWIDAEVHLFPREWCVDGWRPPATESVLLKTVFDHPDRDLALAGAHLEGLLAELDRSGVHGAVIMGLPWLDPELCDRNNAAVAEAANAHPDRFIGLGLLPPPDRGDPVEAVARIREVHGLKGVKVIPAWQGWRLDDAAMDPVYREVAARGLVLFPHTDHPYLPDDGFDPPHRLFRVIQRHPDLKVAAPHLGGLLAAYGLYGPVREALKNVLFVGSVPKTMPMIRWAVEAVGIDRVAFGTDFPFNPSHDQRTMKQELLAMGFSAEELDRLAGANVLDFFGVEG